MRIGILVLASGLFFFLVFLLSAQAARTEGTRLELTEAGTGRKIFSAVLKDGMQVVLTRVTFAGSGGSSPPEVSPADVDDLYQTGDAFTARGLAKPFRQIAYRVSEIGKPRMKIGERVVDFKKEVGFGGGIILSARVADVD